MPLSSIILACISLLVLLPTIWAIAKTQAPTYHAVCMPKAFGVFSILFSAVAFLVGFFATSTEFLLIAIGCIVFAVLFLVIYQSLDIRFDHDGFLVKRLLKPTRYFTYNEIKGIIPHVKGGFTLVLTSGKIMVDELAVGGQDFLDFSEYKYREAGLGTCIPDVKETIFRGNVKEPWPIVFATVLVGALVVLLAIIVTVDACLLGDGIAFGEVTHVVLFCWGLAAVYWLCVGIGYYILCHADKHPILAALLIKKEFRNF